MLHAFPHGEDRGIGGQHPVIHLQAPPAGQARFLGERDVGTDTGGHHHDIGRQDGAVGEFHRLDAIRAVDDFGVRLGQDGQTAAGEIVLQQPRRYRIELAFHQRGHDVQDGGGHAVAGQAIGGLQPQQPAADDDRVGAGLAGGQHGFHVGEVAEPDHARKLVAGQGDDHRVRPGGEQQHVIGPHRAIGAGDDPVFPVDGGDRLVGNQLDPLPFVPGVVVGDDRLEGLLAGQDGGEQDAVIGAMRFGTEDGDGEGLRCAIEDFLQRADAGHAVADQDQAAARGRDHVHARGSGLCGQGVWARVLCMGISPCAGRHCPADRSREPP